MFVVTILLRIASHVQTPGRRIAPCLVISSQAPQRSGSRAVAQKGSRLCHPAGGSRDTVPPGALEIVRGVRRSAAGDTASCQPAPPLSERGRRRNAFSFFSSTAVLVIVAFWFCAVTPLAAKLPPGAKIIAENKDVLFDAFEEKDGESIATSRAKVQVTIPPAATAIHFQWRSSTASASRPTTPDFKPSAPAPGNRPATNAGAAKDDHTSFAEVIWANRAIERINVTPSDANAFPDAYLQLPWALKFYTRPNVEFYRDDQKTKARAVWDTFPAASTHLLAMELRRSPEGTELWADGRLVRQWTNQSSITQLSLSVPRGGAIREIRWTTNAPSLFQPLAVESFARSTPAFSNAIPSLATGETTVAGIPLRIAPAGKSLAVAGLGRLACPSDDLVSFYWRRTAFDGLPESRIVSVPLADYAFAHVLCAAEAEGERVPAFTLRLTRYSNGRGNALADTLVRLPAAGATASEDCKQVGTLAYGAGTTRRTVPLWLVRVPLKSGLIQDLLREDETKYGFRGPFPAKRYLDFEILDPVAGVDANDAFPPSLKPTGRTYTPSGPLSSVVICGLTLEAAPASLTVRSSTKIAAIYAAEKPELLATVDGTAGRYTVTWDLADVDGRPALSGKHAVTLTAAQPAAVVTVPTATLANGWYAARLRLLDSTGRELADNRSTFVLLPPDTRKAGFESPHGAWWFHWAHGGAPDLERVGPLYQRAGLRHANLPPVTEAQTKAHDLYSWCVYWKGSLLTNGTTAEKVAAYEGYIRDTLQAHPSVNTVMFWHESSSSGAPVPSELWGQKPPPLKADDEKAWTTRVEILTGLARMVREKFPTLKTQFGNSGDGCSMVGELFRRGFPRDLVDYVAVEDLGQTFIPERPLSGAMQSAWLLRQTARVTGATNAAITGCYEWIGRRDVALGLGGQAEWLVRDALQARAYGFHAIALSTIHDAGKGYYHTIWGSGGLCSRYPYMYPKPSYAALATLTRVLDGATCERVVPTGSLTLCALEFRRPADRLYALWAPRGKREAKLSFAAEADVTVSDLYGRERHHRGREITIEAGEGACYVATTAKLERITAGSSSFPDEPPPAKVLIVEPLADLARVELSSAKEPRLERTAGWTLPHRTHGEFTLRTVEDTEKGRCLEVELKPTQPVSWDLQHEYAFLKFHEPVVASGTNTSVGVWVRGNSGWGDVMWEVANAKGEKWLTTGVYWDWPGKLAINFDGWHFLRLELPDRWRPGLRVTGLALTLPRRTLLITEMAPVPEMKVRLKDVSVF